MGSSISIRNATEVPLNISLKQLGPLYYKNEVKPGEEVTWDVGKVWFTIEAKISNGNAYRERDRVIPIVLATGGVCLFIVAAVVVAVFATSDTKAPVPSTTQSSRSSTASNTTTPATRLQSAVETVEMVGRRGK